MKSIYHLEFKLSAFIVSWGLFFLAVRDVLPLSYYNTLHIVNIEKQSASSPIGPFPVYILDI